MEKHFAHDSHHSKAKKDKINIKKKGIKSPDLKKMFSVKCYIQNIMGKKYSHTAYNMTKEGLIENMTDRYIYDEIKEPEK